MHTENNEKKYFNIGIAQLLFYKTNHGNLDIPGSYVSSDNFPLGKWVREIRDSYSNDLLNQDEIKRLDALGFSFASEDQNWESMFCYLRQYYEAHGDIKITPSYKTDDGKLLGAWAYWQKRIFYMLSEDKKQKLLSLMPDNKDNHEKT